MTTDRPDTDATPDSDDARQKEQQAKQEQQQAEIRALWETTVSTLTAAARIDIPGYGALDLAGFLASALGAVAGNLGSTYRVTAGRPGSWESDLVRQLVEGTVGTDEDDVLSHRTEPVHVTLNVADLVVETWIRTPVEKRTDVLQPCDDAVDAVYDWGENVTEEMQARADAEAKAIHKRYQDAYTAYGQAFEAAVLEAAKDLPLTVPVSVKVEADPDGGWTEEGVLSNPTEWDDDGTIELRLWQTARQKVGLPTLDHAPTAAGDETAGDLANRPTTPHGQDAQRD